MEVEAGTVIIIVDCPPPVIVVLKVTVTPDGWPPAPKVMVPSNPLVAVLVMVEFAEPPCTTETIGYRWWRHATGRGILLRNGGLRLVKSASDD